MTPSDLTTRVTLDTCAAVGALAALGWWLVGASTGVGVLAGGALAVVNFRWLVARAFVATELGSTSSAAWILGAGLRFAARDPGFQEPLSVAQRNLELFEIELRQFPQHIGVDGMFGEQRLIALETCVSEPLGHIHVYALAARF